MKKILNALFAAALLAAAPAFAGQTYAPMAPFAPLAGTAWRGEGTAPDGSSVVDYAVYELILGGRALQATHRLEDGSYGGRTIIFYDEGAKEYVFHYFTTAGFHTTGSLELTEEGFDSIEKVNGHPDVAEVRASARIGDGVITVESETVMKDGAVKEHGGFVYREIAERPALFGDGQ